MRRARGDKALVKFIARCIERDEQQHQAGFAPVPGMENIFHRFMQGAPEQHREHGVFDQVRAFSGDQDDEMHRVIGNLGKQPVQQWRKDAGGVFKGFRIA